MLVSVNFFVDPANLFHHRTIQEGQSYEEHVAHQIISGYHVTNVETMDERLFQKHVISLLPSRTPPDVVILGSSRCQMIGDNIFPGKTVMNNGVTGATIEDLLAIVNMYDSLELPMNEIFIELSPWYLNDNNGQTRWKSISPDYTAFVNKLQLNEHQKLEQPGNVSWIDPKVLELFSFEYFQQSVKHLLNRSTSKENSILFSRSEFVDGFSVGKLGQQTAQLMDHALLSENDTLASLNKMLTNPDLMQEVKKLIPDQEFPGEIISMYNDLKKEIKANREMELLEQNVCMLNRKVLEVAFYETCPPSPETLTYPTTSRNNSGLTRLSDGTISYPQSFRDQSEEEVSQAVRSFLNTPVFGLENFTDISASRLMLLERTLEYLENNKVTVRLVLVPYHPEVYRTLINDKKYEQALIAETAYRNLAKKMGIQIAGAYNPTSCRVTASDFYDAMHPKEDAYGRIFDTHISD